MKQDPFIEGLRAVFAKEGAPAPAYISAKAGLDKSAIRKMLNGESKSPKLSNAIAIANALGMSIDEISHPDRFLGAENSVPVVGTVGAGARVPVFSAYDRSTAPQVACPPGIDKAGVVAVEIDGDSMEPVYSAGDLLFYTRHTADGVPTEAIGRRCICECENGFGWVKQVRLGSEPGLFNLVSINPAADNQHDVRLRWAAPVKLHWPKELVKKIS